MSSLASRHLTVDVADLALLGHGEEGLDGRVGGDERHKARVHELNLVNLLADKLGVNLVGDRLGLLGGGGLAHVEALDDVVLGAALEVDAALLADAHELRT